ncbi:hypothetical protein [Streptomyces prunicolor]|uniref:hypothetical protein n=1 Tax=Streptomyces prunicolor TaxID=67348 RepID=UPI00342934DF
MEQPYNATPEPFEAPEALLITGDALRDMTPDRLETISQMLGGLGLQVTTISDLESVRSPEEEPKPVPVSQADFLKFAEDTGHTSRLATMAWLTVERTYRGQRTDEGLPMLAFSRGEDNIPHVDLRTVKARIDSGTNREEWSNHGMHRANMEFLRNMTERLIPQQDEDDC